MFQRLSPSCFARTVSCQLASAVIAFGLCTTSVVSHASAKFGLGGGFNSNPTPITFLGEGFATDRLQSTGFSCLKNGKHHFAGAATTSIRFGSQKSYDDLERALNVNLSASASYDMFTASSSVGFVRMVQQSKLSASYFFMEQILLPALVFSPVGYSTDALNSIGTQAYESGPDPFRHTCGDSYTQQVFYGAGLFVAIKLNFSSVFDRTAFESSGSLKLSNIGSILSTVEARSKNKHINGNIEVIAYQRGGDPRRLSKVFSRDDKGYHITNCSMDNTSACNNILTGIMGYASDDFSNQVEFDGSKVSGHAYVVRRDIKPYDQLGLAVGPSVVNEEVIGARKRLGELYVRFRGQEEFTRQLLFSKISSFLTYTAKNDLQTEQRALQENIRLLSSPNYGVINCYNEPARCPQTEQKLLATLAPVNDSVIETFNQAYNFRNLANNPGYALPIGGSMFLYYYPFQDMPSLINTAVIREQGDRLKIVGNNRKFSVSGQLNKITEDAYSGDLTVNNITSRYTYSRVDNPIYLDTDTVYCYDIKLKSSGAYILGYETLENPDSCGGKVDASIHSGEYTHLQLAPGAKLYLQAKLGRSTTITANQSGTIHCGGSSLIGFGCGWEDE